MTLFDWLQIALYLLILLLLVKPLGAHMARVYQGERVFLTLAIGSIERLVYRVLGIPADEEMDWKRYSIALLLFALAGIILLYALQRLQSVLPLNPQHLGTVQPDLASNTAVSFATNTNWQSYGGETTMSYLTQMLGLTVQNFLSAATGMAILVAMIRGFVRHSAKTTGNFWVDMTRSVLYILLPLSLILAVVLVSQGVVQTFSGAQTTVLLQPTQDAAGQTVSQQVMAVGPVVAADTIVGAKPEVSLIVLKDGGDVVVAQSVLDCEAPPVGPVVAADAAECAKPEVPLVVLSNSLYFIAGQSFLGREGLPVCSMRYSRFRRRGRC
jgi:K+-transporting ATPase ATPase A chain